MLFGVGNKQCANRTCARLPLGKGYMAVVAVEVVEKSPGQVAGKSPGEMVEKSHGMLGMLEWLAEHDRCRRRCF